MCFLSLTSVLGLSPDTLYPRLNGGQSVQATKPTLDLSIITGEKKTSCDEPAANTIWSILKWNYELEK